MGGLLKEAEALAAGRPTPDLIPDVFETDLGIVAEPDGAAPETATPAPAATGDFEAGPPPPTPTAPARMAAPDNSTFALRQLLEELAAQLRCGVEKLGELPHETGDLLARELGLATREELDTIELRLAQLEHRLKLLENA